MERMCLHIELDDSDFDALARGEMLVVASCEGSGAVRVKAFARCLPGFDDPLPDPEAMAIEKPPWPPEHPVWGGADVLLRMHEAFDAQLSGAVTVAGRHEDVRVITPRCDPAEAAARQRARADVIAERERIAWEAAKIDAALDQAA